MFQKFFTVLFFLLVTTIYVNAQEKTDSTITAKANVEDTKSPKKKEIKKLEDPLLALPYELITRMKKMKPNQLLVIDEKFVRNEKRDDEYGIPYEVTVTVRLGFSQDMITGIVKEVPLYNTAGRETNIIPVRIPVKFCCTTPIDSVHKKKHCGLMSELNAYEDSEGCKDWIQVEGATGKPGGKIVKKGGGISGETSVVGGDDKDDFGKPTSKKGKKKGKKGKAQLDEDDETTDSTRVSSEDSVVVEKGKKLSKKERRKEAVEKSKSKKAKKERKDEDDNASETDKTPVSKDSTTTKQDKPIDEKPKENVDKKNQSDNEEADFGKPKPKDKSSKRDRKKKNKKEEVDKEEKPEPITPTTEKKEEAEPAKPVQDSTSQEPKEPVKEKSSKRDKKKKKD